MAIWYYNPHAGGSKIPPLKHEQIRRQAIEFAKSRPWSSHSSLVLRFKGQFCYVDTKGSDEEQIMPLCRLRYFHDNSWSLALYTYSHERYEICLFEQGGDTGTLEQALLICEPFIV